MNPGDKICVLDASVAVAWFLEETGSEAAMRLLEPAAPIFHVPAVWLAEIASSFEKQERRGLAQAADTTRYMTVLAGLDLRQDAAGATFAGVERILQRARMSHLSTYDAHYLDLALRLQLPLATLDARLADAAHAAGVGLMLGPARLRRV